MLVGGMLLGTQANAFLVSSEWNDLLPSYSFTSVEEYLAAKWSGKP